jgi:hypothetical protein
MPPHRPKISVWADWNDDDRAPNVAVTIDALWGQQQRFVNLSPDEARSLASHLTAMADAIDEIVDNHEPPDPPGFEAGFAENH